MGPDILIAAIAAAPDRRGLASRMAGRAAELALTRAAEALTRARGTILVATGFLVNGSPETDGPPGAIHLGRSLRSLGKAVAFVAEPSCLEMLRATADYPATFHAFPVADEGTSRGVAVEILDRVAPGALIAIECCGRDRTGTYWNIRGEDVSARTPRIDLLFMDPRAADLPTVGIADGGNEVGFGAADPAIPRSLGIEPCAVAARELIVAAVSNWGAYALIARISLLTGINSLPTLDAEAGLIRGLVAQGAVDGLSGEPVPRVDGFTLGENAEVLGALHEAVDAAISQAGACG